MAPKRQRKHAAGAATEGDFAISRPAATRLTRHSKRTVFSFSDLPQEMRKHIIDLAIANRSKQPAMERAAGYEPLYRAEHDIVVMKRMRLVNKEISGFVAGSFWQAAADFMPNEMQEESDATLAALRQFRREFLKQHAREIKVLRLHQNSFREADRSEFEDPYDGLEDEDYLAFMGGERSTLLAEFLDTIADLEVLCIDVLEGVAPFPWRDVDDVPAIDYRSSLARYVLRHVNLTRLELWGPGSGDFDYEPLHQPFAAELLSHLPKLRAVMLYSFGEADEADLLPDVLSKLRHLRHLSLAWGPITTKWADVSFASPLVVLRLLWTAMTSPAMPLEAIERFIERNGGMLQYLQVDVRSFRSAQYPGPYYRTHGEVDPISYPALQLPKLRGLHLNHWSIRDAGSGLSCAVLERFSASPLACLRMDLPNLEAEQASAMLRSKRFPLQFFHSHELRATGVPATCESLGIVWDRFYGDD